MSEEAWNELHKYPLAADMAFIPTNFTQGGVALFTEITPESTRIEKAFNEGKEGFYGWMGLGGSLFQ